MSLVGPLQLAGREDLQQVQVYVGPAKVGGVAKDRGCSPEGADHNGHLGTLGNFKDAVPEGLQMAGPTGIAFRKTAMLALSCSRMSTHFKMVFKKLPGRFPG